MRALLILVILATLDSNAVCGAEEAPDKVILSCMLKSNVTESEYKKFLTNGLKANEANTNMKCMMKCMMEDQGVLKNGVFDAERAIKEIIKNPEVRGHEVELIESVNGCKAEKGATDCDTAFKIIMCMEEFKSRSQ